MTGNIEEKFVAECRRSGVHPDAAVMQKLAVDFAGSRLVGDLVTTPDKRVIAMRDIVSSLRGSTPESFQSLSDNSPQAGKPATPDERRPGETMTTFMRRLVERKKKPLPSDWDQVRARMTGLTASMMDARSMQRRAK